MNATLRDGSEACRNSTSWVTHVRLVLADVLDIEVFRDIPAKFWRSGDVEPNKCGLVSYDGMVKFMLLLTGRKYGS